MLISTHPLFKPLKGINVITKKIGILLTVLFFWVLLAPMAQAGTILIIKTSLNKDSKSDLLGDSLFKKATDLKLEVEQISLKNYTLPFCDGHEGAAYDNPQVKELHDKIKKASVIIITAPIYNFAVSAATKNLYELTSHPHKDILAGDAWRGKVVAFAGASGSPKSLMAPLSFLNTLILDGKCIIVPEIVMTSGDDIKEKAPTKEINDRLDNLLAQTQLLGKAVEAKPADKK